MKVTVNGQPHELPAGATVASVMETLEVARSGRGVAVALDGEVISRSHWSETQLREGALVEVVAAIQGG
jgi:sulfur carrier protein